MTTAQHSDLTQSETQTCYENNKKWLVIMPEVAYVTLNNGEGPIDSWDAPQGKFFKAMRAIEIPMEMEHREAFLKAEIVNI